MAMPKIPGHDQVAGGEWGLYRKKKSKAWLWILLALFLLWIMSSNNSNGEQVRHEQVLSTATAR